jgi:hypothetical protein
MINFFFMCVYVIVRGLCVHNTHRDTQHTMICVVLYICVIMFAYVYIHTHRYTHTMIYICIYTQRYTHTMIYAYANIITHIYNTNIIIHMYNTNLKISRAFAFGQEHQEMQEHRSKHQQMLTQFKDLKGIRLWSGASRDAGASIKASADVDPV